MTNNSITSIVRLRAVLLGGLVACSFLITLGLCALAFSLAIDQTDSISTTMRVFMGFGLVITLAIAFAIASAITCASVLLESRRSAFIHAVGSWAFLSLLVGVPSLLIAMNLGLSFNVRPLIVTEISIMKSTAVTSVTFDYPHNMKKKIATDPNPVTHFIALSMFLSLLLGCGASIASANLVYTRQARLRA